MQNNIPPQISSSRQTVYQMLDYVKDRLGLKIIQQETGSLFLIKVEPYLDSLYNYAHVLGEEINEQGVAEIKKFFGPEKFRIKIPESEHNRELLLAQGFNFKSADYAMRADNLLTKNYDFILPEKTRIEVADRPAVWNDVKLIFADAFGCSPHDCDHKIGFLEQFALDKNEKHIKAFVVYADDQPVSTGTYYAFDNFSIESIGTIKSARGKGYAGLIMRTLLQEAQRLNYGQACLEATEAGVPVYSKLGFEVVNKTEQFINY